MTRVMTPRIRKAALVAYVVCSVGWLGMVLAFIAMAVMGIVSADEMVVRGTYRVMEQVAWWALVPLAVASLVTGVLQSLGRRGDCSDTTGWRQTRAWGWRPCGISPRSSTPWQQPWYCWWLRCWRCTSRGV